MGTLYVVATPIGNMEDITLRALRVLSEVAVVAAEDTRTTRKLLSHHGISARRVVSYNEHNMKRRTPELMQALASGDVALVSDAGTPGLSDPGSELIGAAIESGYAVSPVPGVAALTAALAASGISMREFTFLGFLPKMTKARREVLSQFAADQRTLVVYESPHRVLKALADAKTTLGDRCVAVCRELTKVFEEVFRGTISEAIEHFAEPRGEFTIVIAGASGTVEVTDEDICRALDDLVAQGASRRDAVARVAQETGTPRRRVYAISLQD